MKHQLPIVSKLPDSVIWRPIGFWGFAIFVAICAFMPEKKEEHYPFLSFFWFFIASAFVTSIVLFFAYYSKNEMKVDGKTIELKSISGEEKISYQMIDIVGFEWGNTSEVIGTDAGIISNSNQFFRLKFKDETELEVGINDYKNFDEFRSYFYGYCITNKIIKMRSLEDRKKSRLKR
ncbi:MAG: hypothetical protein IT236_07250 [Bacteroidia bacterium]|nr:hypothetical protein [Bacteroidia bacterium]